MLMFFVMVITSFAGFNVGFFMAKNRYIKKLHKSDLIHSFYNYQNDKKQGEKNANFKF